MVGTNGMDVEESSSLQAPGANMLEFGVTLPRLPLPQPDYHSQTSPLVESPIDNPSQLSPTSGALVPSRKLPINQKPLLKMPYKFQGHLGTGGFPNTQVIFILLKMLKSLC